MKKLKMFGGLAAVALFLASCSTPCPEVPVVEAIDLDAVRTEISALEAEYERASNAHDIEGVLTYYADDAVRYPPDAAALVGKEAIRAKMIENQDTSDHSMTKLVVGDIFADGKYVTEVGTYQDVAPDGTIKSSGRYVCVFELRDGKYLCIRDIWNSEMPRKDMSAEE